MHKLFLLIKAFLRFSRFYHRFMDWRLKNYSIFDIKKMSRTLKNYKFDVHGGNSIYGTVDALKKYSGFKGLLINSVIEHGFYLGNNYGKDEIKFSQIITFSKNRKDLLKKIYPGKIATIGPYIKYADSFYTQGEKDVIKEKYGRILLVFPVHSIKELKVQYDNLEFINKIESIKSEYDTVFICMFSLDIQRGKHVEYLNNGYIIVTAGQAIHCNFINRLKSIIELSDYTITNGFGTHSIYCTALGKKHTIFEQKISISANLKTNIKKAKQAVKEIEALRSDDTMIEQRRIIGRVYGKYPNSDVKVQQEKLDYMFGFSEIKTREEIYNILKNTI